MSSGALFDFQPAGIMNNEQTATFDSQEDVLIHALRHPRYPIIEKNDLISLAGFNFFLTYQVPHSILIKSHHLKKI